MNIYPESYQQEGRQRIQVRISGGRIIDPGHIDSIADVLIEDGTIAAGVEVKQIGLQNQASIIQRAAAQNFDATDKIVTPGLIDMHVHLREPGYEHNETIDSGCRAAQTADPALSAEYRIPSQ